MGHKKLDKNDATMQSRFNLSTPEFSIHSRVLLRKAVESEQPFKTLHDFSPDERFRTLHSSIEVALDIDNS